MVAPDDLERRKTTTRLVVVYEPSDVREGTVEKPRTAKEIEHMELVAEWSSDLRVNLSDEPLVVDRPRGRAPSPLATEAGPTRKTSPACKRPP